jgi:predicted regulator of Ras-like GTPase activity (Roadblock/LC7/MglB family)
MADDSLIIYEEEINQIDSLISKMLKGAEAKCALLVDKDGHLITRQGFTHSLDTTALAALLAGSFASTKEIARLVGEPEFYVSSGQKRPHPHVIGGRPVDSGSYF